MAARVVTFSSAKGGSGKTVLCASFGVALSRLNQRVLLVDADGDTAGMTLFFLDDVIEAKHGHSAEAGGLFDTDAAAPFRPVELDRGLSFLPAQYKLDGPDDAAPTGQPTIEPALTDLRESFDFIFIDAQAGADPVALEAARVSDEVILVAEYDPISAQGVKRLEQLHPAVFAPERTWILYNKVLPELTTTIGSLLRVERHLRPVPWNADVVRHFVEGELAVNMDAPNPFTLAVVENLETLFRRRLRESIERWREGAAEALRAPIRDQLDRVEAELDDLTRQRIEMETDFDLRRRRIRMFTTAALAIGVAAALTAVLVTARGSALSFLAPLGAVIAALASTLFAESTLRMSRRIGGTEARVLLARLERRYTALDEQRRQLAVTADEALRSIGADHLDHTAVDPR